MSHQPLAWGKAGSMVGRSHTQGVAGLASPCPWMIFPGTQQVSRASNLEHAEDFGGYR